MARAVAYRLWIKDLAGGEYTAGKDITNPTFVKLGERKVSRVDVMGRIVEKNDSSFAVEDKTGKIRVRFFGGSMHFLNDAQNNDTVRVIGKIREDNSGRFIAGEIVKKIADANYLLLREKELGRL
jgi:RPA family protein